MRKDFKRTLKWSGIITGGLIVILLLLMYLLPKIYLEQIDHQVRVLLKENVKGDVEYEDIEISFFRKFPFLTASLDKPSLQGVILDDVLNDKLLEAESISLGINLLALITGDFHFDRIYIDKPITFIYVNEEGEANYNIFYGSEDVEQEIEKENDLGLKINRLQIKDAEVIYNDLASNLSFVASGFDYVGRGNMNEAVFDLKSVARINSFDFNFDGVHYIKEKPILAKLETLVDTKSLTFGFEKNSIKIKGLPVDFKGHFSFVEGGYDMLFDIKTEDATFEQLLSVIPPSYQGWLDNTTFGGLVEGKLVLGGKYIISKNLSPDLDFSISLKDGMIHNNKVQVPMQNLNVDLALSIPGLHFEKNQLDIKNFSFDLGENHSSVVWKSSGLDSIVIDANIQANMDLAVFNSTLGIEGFQMQGQLNMDAQLDGLYASTIKYRRIRDKVVSRKRILSVPVFDIQGSLKDGYFQFAELPEGIKNINVSLSAKGKDSNWRNTTIDINELSLVAMENLVKADFHIGNFRDLPMEGKVTAKVDLDNLKKFLPIEHMTLKGLIDLQVAVNGSFKPRLKQYPIINAEIQVSQGYAQLAKFPELPIENVSLQGSLKSTNGNLSGISLDIKPLEVTFAGEEFKLEANLVDFANLKYVVKSNGVLNIGDLYEVFPIEGLEVSGKVQTNFFLKGSQSDVVAGNYDLLQNAGRATVQDIKINSKYFPKSLEIQEGVFSFYKERMKFDKFAATYGSSSFTLDGYLTNVIGFLMNKSSLQGMFSMNTPYLDVDEFMVVNTPVDVEARSVEEALTQSSVESINAVVQIPKNVDLEFNATADRIKYLTYNITDFEGDLKLLEGKMFLDKANFELIGTKVQMQAAYEPLGLKSAAFDYHILAKDFDIQRAYNEVPLFREMVSMAENAYGSVSLDYELKGLLNQEMFPVLSSIEGQGDLVLEDIQFKGFKLLGAIADRTDSKAMEKAKVSQVTVSSIIDDNIITIDRTRLRMAGFRPRFEGQVSLDGDINIGVRLGLPPLGLIGIPMKISGTMEDFDIKLGKYRPSEVLGGSTKYDEEDALADQVEEKLQQELDSQIKEQLNKEVQTELEQFKVRSQQEINNLKTAYPIGD